MRAVGRGAAIALSALALAAPALADAPKGPWQDEPARAAVSEAQPYEVVSGTHIPLVLIHADPAMVVAQCRRTCSMSTAMSRFRKAAG